MKYVDLVVDNASNSTDNLYTYRCSDDDIKVGDIVKVPFARRRKDITGYVFAVSDHAPENIKGIRDVASVSDEYSLPPDLIRMSSWMKHRYMCRYIDAISCMIPPGKKPKRAPAKDPLDEYTGDGASSDAPPLTEEQQAAFDRIKPKIHSREMSYFLLNGVTSSGKTEVYLRACEETLKEGRDAMILVPEISLTPQTISRFTARFGADKVAVMHSKLTKGQRYVQWMRARNGEAKIMIGARSAVFAPLADPGLIVIDEEHESSYKADQTPKYDAVSAALMRAKISGSVVILGSATPSVVSSYRAKKGYYTELKLLKRHNKTPLPEVSIVDMRDELKDGNRGVFSSRLYNDIKKTLEEGRQVILFLNRRGYSSFISCRSCGYVMKCSTCGISMTYHKSSGMAECHYCGRRVRVPDVCPECGSSYIRYFGAGTEQVEEAAAELFPEAVCARLDLDTAKKKGETKRILNLFRRGKINILVGTQLVAKGLDFDNVGLVGIVAADVTLNIPDYRSAERTYQLIVQASGRAGRGDRPGSVIIQTYAPDDRTIEAAARGDYAGFLREELAVREVSGYPPFTNIIRLVFSGEDEVKTRAEADSVFREIEGLAVKLGAAVFSPQPAYMAKLNGRYRFQILVKSPVARTKYCRRLVENIKKERSRASGTADIVMVAELDPYSIT
ncbi:MAG: primosomal protein N' [Anaerovoracaceae bacterium]|nr:primosomal protein N' [Bacillota bacterium]MDY2670093.1 primosomal protein N' [Anaerovoracaceae bacterium]